MGGVVAALIVGNEAFRTILLPFDRPRDLAARPYRERLFGIDEGLHAETAAHIGRDNAELLFRNLEYGFGERIAHEMRTLRPGIEGRAAALRIVVHNRVAGLHRIRHQAIVDQINADDVGGLGKGGFGRFRVAEIVVPIEHEVARNMVEKLRRARRERVLRVRDHRQCLVVDFDCFGGIARLAQGLGDDKRDRLADITDLLDRQERTRGLVLRRAITILDGRLASEVAEPFGLNVGAGGDEQDARHLPRRRCIDPPKVRVRGRRAQNKGLRRMRQAHVIRVAAPSGDKPQILVAPNRLPNAEFHADLMLCNALDMGAPNATCQYSSPNEPAQAACGPCKGQMPSHSPNARPKTSGACCARAVGTEASRAMA